MKMKIPNVIRPVETEKEKLRSSEPGRLRSCSLEALALPALLAPPRLFTLAGRCVSLLCWLRGWGGARGPERSLGEQDAEMRGPGWEVGGAVSGERKLYS